MPGDKKGKNSWQNYCPRFYLGWVAVSTGTEVLDGENIELKVVPGIDIYIMWGLG